MSLQFAPAHKVVKKDDKSGPKLLWQLIDLKCLSTTKQGEI